VELVAIAEIRREMLRVAQELLAFCFDVNFIVHIVYLFYLGNQWNVHRVFGFNSICMEILLYIGCYKEHGASLGGSYLWRQLTRVIRDIGKG